MEPETRTQKPRRSLVGCLFSGSMGCGAFVFGAAVSAALFAPTMLGDVVAKWVESAFSRNHDGTLVVENLQLSWVDSQRANGVKLLNRSGETIVILNAQFPSLLTILGLQSSPQEWDVDVQRARVEIDADGVANLQDAMADRDRAFDWAAFLDSSLIGDGDLQIPGEDPDWPWPALRVRASAGAVSIADMRQTLEPVMVEALDVLFTSEGEAARLSAERSVVARGAFRFSEGGSGDIDLRRTHGTHDWRGTVQTTDLPTRLAGSLCGARGSLHELMGPKCDLGVRFAAADSGQSGDTQITGEIQSPPSQILWTLLMTDDSVRSVADEAALRIVAPERDRLSAEVTRWLFPWLDSSRSTSPNGGIQVDIDRLEMRREDGWKSLDARAVVTLTEMECPPARAFADDLGLSDDQHFKLASDAPISLSIEGGVLRYEDVAMTVGDHACAFRGQHLLEDDRIEIEIEVPLSFVGQRLLEPGALDLLMPANATVPIQLVGTWRDPILNINLRVLQEAMSNNFTSTLKEKTGEVMLKTFEALLPTDE